MPLPENLACKRSKLRHGYAGFTPWSGNYAKNADMVKRDLQKYLVIYTQTWYNFPWISVQCTRGMQTWIMCSHS